MLGIDTSNISLKQVIALVGSFGAKVEDVADSEIKTEEQITQALDFIEDAAFRDGAESNMLSLTLNGKPAVIFFTIAPTTLVSQAIT